MSIENQTRPQKSSFKRERVIAATLVVLVEGIVVGTLILAVV